MMRPKLIANMIITAIIPSEVVAPISYNVVCEKLPICTRPLTILNR
jgi:hypothetical protein